MIWKRAAIGALPIAIFALYLHTLGPSLVPYRDAGEMGDTADSCGVDGHETSGSVSLSGL